MSEKLIINKSKKYLLPLLSEFIYFDKNIISELENVYIFDETKKYKNCIFLLFNYNIKDSNFTKFENQIFNHNLFVDHYDFKNNKVLYILKFPKEYLYEYKMFIDGKYSEFGKDAQNLIFDFLIDQGVSEHFINKISNIFIKDVKLKQEIEKKLKVMLDDNSELESIIKEEDETINIKNNINHIYD